VIIEGETGDNATPPAREVVGVVGDVRHESLDSEGGPEYYVPYTQAPQSYMSLVVRSSISTPESLSASLREVIRQRDPEQYVGTIQPMTKLVDDAVARRRFNALLTSVFAGVALVLASVGIFGVLNYTVTQRTQEIGLRVALGAQTRDVLRLVLGHGVRLIITGLGIGLIASFALTRVLAGMLFGVTPTDPITFATVSLLLAAVALLACLHPRASRHESRSTASAAIRIVGVLPRQESEKGTVMESLFSDFRYAVRNLIKRPGFTAIAVVTLAVGIGANSAIFSAINALLLKPLPIPNQDRVVAIWDKNPSRGVKHDEVTFPNYFDWRAQNRSFDHLALERWWSTNLTGGDTPERIQGFLVTTNFFDVVGVKPVKGRNFIEGENEPGKGSRCHHRE
jgi:hypothetical protein